MKNCIFVILWEIICMCEFMGKDGKYLYHRAISLSSSFFCISFWLNCCERDILNGVWGGLEPVYLLCGIFAEAVQSVSVLLLYPESCKPFDFCHPVWQVLLEVLNILLLRDCDSPLYVSTKVSYISFSGEETNVQRGLKIGPGHRITKWLGLDLLPSSLWLINPIA